MAERVLKFGGIDPLSRAESTRGEAEPEDDPRGRSGTEVVRGMHLMSAVEQLEPAATTTMAYFDPDAGVGDASVEELQEAVREGELDLTEVMTKTARFTPLVNPRRSRLKRRGELSREGDADLWHVPTDNYQAHPPRSIFQPCAAAIDQNDSVDNSGVFGEFRTRRNGGEVFGELWFEDFDVGAMDGDPVRLGFKFGWNYFGDRAFFLQPWAQQTRCKNSVAPLDDRQTVMHHNRSVDWREMWDEVIRELGLYGDRISQQIASARDLLLDFTGDLDDFAETEDRDEIIPMPMTLEAFYEYVGLPDPEMPADHAREEARNSTDPRESASRLNMWHIHAGATYWLSWHWNGSEDSRAFREYRRIANDLLMNPYQMASRAEQSYEDDVEQQVITDVLGPDADLSDATEQEREQIEERLADHEGIAQVQASVETLEDAVEQFEQTEERLERMAEAMQSAAE